MEPQLDSFEFARAFNDGYIVGLYEQEIGEYMMQGIQSDNDYLFGFKEGLKQGDIERLEHTRLEELNASRNQNTNQDQEQTPNQELER